MNQALHQPNSTSLHQILMPLFRAHRKKAHSQLLEKGITPGQPRILHYLIKHDGCIQRDLAEHCHIEPASVTSVLSSMEKSHLIIRRQNPDDKRILNVYLTEKGRAFQKSVETIFDAIDLECFKGFSPEEQALTLQLLGRIYHNLLEEPKEC